MSNRQDNAARDAGRARYNKAKAERIAAALKWAREWRIRMKPHFDAMYGPEPDRCPCGRLDAQAVPL